MALTFDCGADRGNAPAILDLLQRDGIVATFGVTGRWAEQNPDLIRRMVAQGEQIVDHTYDHQSFTGLSTHTLPLTRAQITTELERGDAILRHITGSSSRPYYRPPYGDESPDTLDAAVSDGFYVDVRWSLDSLGWEGLSAPAIESRVLQDITPGGVLLMHVGAASQDAAALPAIVATLRARGYHFVTVAGLLAADHAPGAPHLRGLRAASSYRAIDPDAVYYPGTGHGPLAGDVVLLDPGHGGDDPGTCYPYVGGCYPSSDPNAPPVLDEKVAALDIALYHLLPRLHLLGADVYLTRTTLEQNPSLESRLQLANYVARVRAVHHHALFISVHLNGADDPSVDYSQALYAAGRPSGLALASTLAAAFGALQPAPNGGDHGADTYPGHVLRRNRLPATIVEPAFLTNVYGVTVPISVTRIVTATSGAALREGLRPFAPVVHVYVVVAHPQPSTPHAGTPRVVAPRGTALAALTALPRATATPTVVPHTTLSLSEAFSGTAPLRAAITLARTTAISAALAATTTVLAVTAPPAPTVLPAPAIPITVTYNISVTGAISASATTTVLQGEGEWLRHAHRATVRANRDYDAPAPARLPLRYSAHNREEEIARTLLQGIATFFHVRLPRQALQPRAAPVLLTPVIPRS